MSSTISGKAVSFKTANGWAPKAGPRVIGSTLTFTALIISIAIDLQRVEDTDKLEFIQTLFIDNTTNPASLTITQGVVNQSLVIPPGCQAYLPVLNTVPLIKFDSLGGVALNANCTINIHYLSMMLPAAIWNPAGGLILDHSANKPALLANVLGTAPANALRSEIEAQNQSANQVQLVIDDAGGLIQSIYLLAPGTGAGNQGADWRSNKVKTRVRILSASAADQVMLRET